jgi:hypothetical protein
MLVLRNFPPIFDFSRQFFNKYVLVAPSYTRHQLVTHALLFDPNQFDFRGPFTVKCSAFITLIPIKPALSHDISALEETIPVVPTSLHSSGFRMV